jgi:beta-phosphoglucomutase-like phosphatase (HAD superfamily)
MIDEIGARYGLTDGQRSTVLNEKKRIYEQEEQGIKIVPGAIEFVRWAAQHYRLALATSATPRNRTATLDRLGIANLFEVVADLGDVSEPNPHRRSICLLLRVSRSLLPNAWLWRTH